MILKGRKLHNLAQPSDYNKLIKISNLILYSIFINDNKHHETAYEYLKTVQKQLDLFSVNGSSNFKYSRFSSKTTGTKQLWQLTHYCYIKLYKIRVNTKIEVLLQQLKNGTVDKDFQDPTAIQRF
ncbi:Hypothetical_protein [Hexamita inflata]|uniref:Hypothetical_protein n=1 Tax=Hexamita inflata TaxID=28002 RepID=A0AA86UKW1_9EUKA|nr:Hypothetical protein HINF_LOCUS31053 [Hexamita inflata]